MKLSVFNRGMEVNGLQYSVSLLFEYRYLIYVKIHNEANEWCKYCHKQAQ